MSTFKQIQKDLAKPKRERDPKYLKFVREKGCVLSVSASAHPCTEADGIDAHHVKPEGGGIMGSKVSDYRAVGLCRLHHQMAHDYPVSHRPFLETAIRKLKREYDSLFPAKPLRERKTKARVQHLLILCECGKVHRLAPTKCATMTLEAVSYWCPFRKSWLIASFRRTA